MSNWESPEATTEIVVPPAKIILWELIWDDGMCSSIFTDEEYVIYKYNGLKKYFKDVKMFKKTYVLESKEQV
jgi:hypothetical protein